MIKSKSLSAQLINGCSFYNDSESSKRFERSINSKGQIDGVANSKCLLKSSKSFSSMVKPNVTLIRRRSAVERLQESKANYVKSEYVRDSQQHLTHKNQTFDPLNRNHFEVQPLHSISPDQRKSFLPPKYLSSTYLSCSGLLNRNRSLVNKLNESPFSYLDSNLKHYFNESQENSNSLEPDHNQHPPFSSSSYSPSKSSSVLGKSLPDLSYDKESFISPTFNHDIYSEKKPPISKKCILSPRNNSSHKNSCLLTSNIVNALKSSVANINQYQDVNSKSKTSTISRSKSDIGHRFSKQTKPKSKDEIERFFDTIGLDSTTWASIMAHNVNSFTSTPLYFFNSTNSLDSNARHISISSSSLQSQTKLPDQHCNELSNLKLNQLSPSISKQTSIVEKNARIIKWLYNCKKAMVQDENIN